jgi:hypothetical protein
LAAISARSRGNLGISHKRGDVKPGCRIGNEKVGYVQAAAEIFINTVASAR